MTEPLTRDQARAIAHAFAEAREIVLDAAAKAEDASD